MHALHYLWALQSEENVHRRRLRRRNRPRVDINNMLEFYHTFRLSRDSFESLCARLVQHALLTNSQDVTVRQKVLCALHFFASGSYQRALATGHCVSQQALSDSGYALKPWLLLTPITGAPPGSREYRYTKVHAKTRNRIERCIGLLKSRWRCLLKHKTLHYNPDIAQKIIIACCILHNMAIEHNIPPIELSEEDFRDEEVVVQDVNEEIDLRGLAVLNNLITTHFQ
ncbi:Putative nuclease HARBI1 [Eumeta japonica]|uniref:Nuclease HARBI1 n=1 Tax=Eumeta variegata TaxID=151549 RepID=A0A4C1SXD9_EUMVA|nr:Putative nuclease HARBI1 [Eumeta japonica]